MILTIRTIFIFLYGLLIFNFGLAQEYSTFLDSRDGRVYKTLQIGNKKWMIENLNTIYFQNGDKIKIASNLNEWNYACDKKNPICCYYNFDIRNNSLGLIYNYYAFIDKRNIAPIGFRLLKDSDYFEKAIPIINHGGTYAGIAEEFFGKNEFTLFWTKCEYEDYPNKNCFWNIIPTNYPLVFDDFNDRQGLYIICLQEN